MNINKNITKKRKTRLTHMLVFFYGFFGVYNIVILLLLFVLRSIGRYWEVLVLFGGCWWLVSFLGFAVQSACFGYQGFLRQYNIVMFVLIPLTPLYKRHIKTIPLGVCKSNTFSYIYYYQFVFFYCWGYLCIILYFILYIIYCNIFFTF